MLAVTADDVAAMGAFALGVIAGGYAVIQVFRFTILYLRRDADEHRDDLEDGDGADDWRRRR